MVSNGPPPGHWNSYRPSYHGKTHSHPRRDLSSRHSPGFEANPRSARGSNGPPLSSRRDRSNRSRSPAYRHRRRRESSDRHRQEDSGRHEDSERRRPEGSDRHRRRRSPSIESLPALVTKVHDSDSDSADNSKIEKPAPLLWPADLDDLMGRTVRAHDLVVNYERDSEGGVRWDAAAISILKCESKKFHERVAKLSAWTNDPEGAKAKPEEFANDMRLVRLHCDYIQRVIIRTECNVQGEGIWALEKAREAEEQGGED